MNKTDQELVQELVEGKFAKLFEFDGEQLLLRWEYNVEDDVYELTFDMRLAGIRCNMTLNGFQKIEDCLKAFENIDEEAAKEFYQAHVDKADGNPLNLIIDR